MFLTGGKLEPHNDNVIAISRSENDGKTWSEPETLFSHESRGCWCTEIFTECENPFAVVHTYNAPKLLLKWIFASYLNNIFLTLF